MPLRISSTLGCKVRNLSPTKMIVHGVTDTAQITLGYNMLQMPVDRWEAYIQWMLLMLLLLTIFDWGDRVPVWQVQAGWGGMSWSYQRPSDNPRSILSPLISFKPYFLTGSYHTMLFISAFLGRLECVLFPFLFLPRTQTYHKRENGLRAWP